LRKLKDGWKSRGGFFLNLVLLWGMSLRARRARRTKKREDRGKTGESQRDAVFRKRDRHRAMCSPGGRGSSAWRRQWEKGKMQSSTKERRWRRPSAVRRRTLN